MSAIQWRAYSVMSDMIYKTVSEMGGSKYANKRSLEAMVKKGILKVRDNVDGEPEYKIIS